MRQRPGDQRLPEPNDRPGCHETFVNRVNMMMKQRLMIGIERYGTKLQPFNKRDFMQDAWEELCDLSVYMEGVAQERDAMIDLLKKVAVMTSHDMASSDLRFEARIMLTKMGIEVPE